MYLKKEWIKAGLRISLGVIFLSAVADRFGLWPKDVSAWYTWSNFLDYTSTLNPWFPVGVIPLLGIVVTGLEIVLGTALILNYKIKTTSLLSGVILFIFALAMCFTTGVKGMLDYGVLPLIFSALALRCMED